MKRNLPLDSGNLWGGHMPVQRPPPPPYPPHTYTDSQGARHFIDGGRGLHTETAQLALPITLKLVIEGLTSVILLVLGTVNLQFQGPFVPISLWSVLGIVAAFVVGAIWSSCS